MIPLAPQQLPLVFALDRLNIDVYQYCWPRNTSGLFEKAGLIKVFRASVLCRTMITTGVSSYSYPLFVHEIHFALCYSCPLS